MVVPLFCHPEVYDWVMFRVPVAPWSRVIFPRSAAAHVFGVEGAFGRFQEVVFWQPPREATLVEACRCGLGAISFVVGLDLPTERSVDEIVAKVKSDEPFFVRIGDWLCVSREIAMHPYVSSVLVAGADPRRVAEVVEAVSP